MKERICLNCFQKAKQRNKGECPSCGVPCYLYDSPKGGAYFRPNKDIEAVTSLTKTLDAFISKRDKVVVNTCNIPAERNGAMVFLDTCRQFLKENKSSIDLYDFANEVLRVVLADPYWMPKIESFHMIKSQIRRYSKQIYIAKKERIQEINAWRSAVEPTYGDIVL